MAILLNMDISLRNVPADLWYRVRKAAASEGSPEHRVTIREVVMQALEEWLTKRGY